MSFDRDLRKFVEDLIDAIGYSGVEEIPLSSEKFGEGIKNLKAVFENVAPADYASLDLAFMPDVITGDYSRIEQIICSSSLVSLDASSFDKVRIKTSYSGEKPTQLFEILAQSFCRGAGLKK
jgi:hypothetical protein